MTDLITNCSDADLEGRRTRLLEILAQGGLSEMDMKNVETLHGLIVEEQMRRRVRQIQEVFGE